MANKESRQKKRPYEAVRDTAIWSFLYITIYHKITAVLTAVLFLFSIIGTDMAWALKTEFAPSGAGLGREDDKLEGKELNIDDFEIPTMLGSVKDKHKGKTGTIIYIQDAHCNYAAQKSIAKIINHLNETYGVNLINLEGGAGGYDLSLFTDIKDKDVRKEVSDYFMKEGRVAGAEFFAINNPQKVTLFGIENEDLYIKNLDVYKDSLKYVTGVNDTLNYITSRLKALKKHIYTETLLKLDEEYKNFKDEKVELKEFIQYLFDLTLKKRIGLKKFPNIRSLYKAISKEKDIDFKKANSERNKLIDELKEELSDNDMDRLMLRSFLFKTGQLSQATYYNYLKEIADKYKVSLRKKRNLSNYIVYINLYEEADKTEVFNEIEDVFELVVKKEFKNETQKTLFKMSKHTRILKNIFNIKATRNEINYFNKHKHEFAISTILDFIERESLKYGGSPHFDNSAYLIDEKRDKIIKFYKFALARDEAFVRNIRRSHRRFEEDTSIIVAGGFHTENLTELLKKNHFSYVVIRPTFKNGNNYKSPYYKLLSGGLSDIEEKVVEAVSAIAIASIFNGLSVRVLGEEGWKVLKDNLEIAKEVFEGITTKGKFILKTKQNGTIEFTLRGDNIIAKDVETEEFDAELDESVESALAKLKENLDRFRRDAEGAAVIATVPELAKETTGSSAIAPVAAARRRGGFIRKQMLPIILALSLAIGVVIVIFSMKYFRKGEAPVKERPPVAAQVEKRAPLITWEEIQPVLVEHARDFTPHETEIYRMLLNGIQQFYPDGNRIQEMIRSGKLRFVKVHDATEMARKISGDPTLKDQVGLTMVFDSATRRLVLIVLDENIFREPRLMLMVMVHETFGHALNPEGRDPSSSFAEREVAAYPEAIKRLNYLLELVLATDEKKIILMPRTGKALYITPDDLRTIIKDQEDHLEKYKRKVSDQEKTAFSGLFEWLGKAGFIFFPVMLLHEINHWWVGYRNSLGNLRFSLKEVGTDLEGATPEAKRAFAKAGMQMSRTVAIGSGLIAIVAILTSSYITLAIAAYIGVGAVMDIAKSKRDRAIIAEAEEQREAVVAVEKGRPALGREVDISGLEGFSEEMSFGPDKRYRVKDGEVMDIGVLRANQGWFNKNGIKGDGAVVAVKDKTGRVSMNIVLSKGASNVSSTLYHELTAAIRLSEVVSERVKDLPHLMTEAGQANDMAERAALRNIETERPIIVASERRLVVTEGERRAVETGIGRAEELLGQGKAKAAEEALFNILPDRVEREYSKEKSTFTHQGQLIMMDAGDLLNMARLYLSCLGTYGAERVSMFTDAIRDNPHLLVPIRRHISHLVGMRGFVWDYIRTLEEEAVHHTYETTVEPERLLNSPIIREDFVAFATSFADRLGGKRKKGDAGMFYLLNIATGVESHGTLPDQKGIDFLIKNADRALALGPDVLRSYIAIAAGYQNMMNRRFMRGLEEYSNPLLSIDSLEVVKRCKTVKEAEAHMKLISLNRALPTLCNREGLLDSFGTLSAEQQDGFAEYLWDNFFKKARMEPTDALDIDTIKTLLSEGIVDIYRKNGALANPLLYILAIFPQDEEGYCETTGSSGIAADLDSLLAVSRTGVGDEYVLAMVALGENRAEAKKRSFTDTVTGMAQADREMAKGYLSVVKKSRGDMPDILSAEFRTAFQAMAPAVREAYVENAVASEGEDLLSLPSCEVVSTLKSPRHIKSFRNKLKDTEFAAVLADDGKRRSLAGLLRDAEAEDQGPLLSSFKPSMLDAGNTRTQFINRIRQHIKDAELLEDIIEFVADNPVYAEYFLKDENFEFLLKIIWRSKNFAQGFMLLMLHSGRPTPQDLDKFRSRFEDLIFSKDENFAFEIIQMIGIDPSVIDRLDEEMLRNIERLYGISYKVSQSYCVALAYHSEIADSAIELYERVIDLLSTDGEEALKCAVAIGHGNFSKRLRTTVFFMEEAKNREPYGWQLAEFLIDISTKGDPPTALERFNNNEELIRKIHPEMLERLSYALGVHKGIWDETPFLREDVLAGLGRLDSYKLVNSLNDRYRVYLANGDTLSANEIASLFTDDSLFELVSGCSEGRSKLITNLKLDFDISGRAIKYIFLSKESDEQLEKLLNMKLPREFYDRVFDAKFHNLKAVLRKEFGENIVKVLMMRVTRLKRADEYLEEGFLEGFIRNVDTIFGREHRGIFGKNVTLSLFDLMCSDPEKLRKAMSEVSSIVGKAEFDKFLKGKQYNDIVAWFKLVDSLKSEQLNALKGQIRQLPAEDRVAYLTAVSRFYRSEFLNILLTLDIRYLQRWSSNPKALIELHLIYERMVGYKIDMKICESFVRAILVSGGRNLVYELRSFYASLRETRTIRPLAAGEKETETRAFERGPLSAFLDLRGLDPASKPGKKTLRAKVTALRYAGDVGALVFNDELTDEVRTRVRETAGVVNSVFEEPFNRTQTPARIKGLYRALMKRLLSDVTGLAEIDEGSLGDEAIFGKLMTLLNLYYSIPDKAGCSNQDRSRICEGIKNMLTLYVNSKGDQTVLGKAILENPANKDEIERLQKRGYKRSLWTKGIEFETEVLPVGEAERVESARQDIAQISEELIDIAKRLNYRPEGVSEDELEALRFTSYDAADRFVSNMRSRVSEIPNHLNARCREILNNIKGIEEDIEKGIVGAAKERVTIVVRKDFLGEATIGEGRFSGCYGTNGGYREKPVADSMEINVFLARAYNESGEIIGNVELALTDDGVVVFASYDAMSGHNLDAAWLEAWARLTKLAPAVILSHKGGRGKQVAGIRAARMQGLGRSGIPSKDVEKRPTLWGNMYYDFGSWSNQNGSLKYKTGEEDLWLTSGMFRHVEDMEEDEEEAAEEPEAEEKRVELEKQERKQITAELFRLGLDVELRPLLSPEGDMNIDDIILRISDAELDGILQQLKKRRGKERRGPPENADPKDVGTLRQRLQELREEFRLNKGFELLIKRLLDKPGITFSVAKEMLFDILTDEFNMDLDIAADRLDAHKVDITEISPEHEALLSQLDNELRNISSTKPAKHQSVESSMHEALFGEFHPDPHRDEVIIHGEITLTDEGVVTLNFVPGTSYLAIYNQDTFPEGKLVLQFELYEMDGQLRLEIVDAIAKRSNKQMEAYGLFEAMAQRIADRLDRDVIAESETAIFSVKSIWDGEKYLFEPRKKDVSGRFGYENVKSLQTRIKLKWIEEIQPNFPHFEDMSTPGIDQRHFAYYQKRIVPTAATAATDQAFSGLYEWLGKAGFIFFPVMLLHEINHWWAGYRNSLSNLRFSLKEVGVDLEGATPEAKRTFAKAGMQMSRTVAIGSSLIAIVAILTSSYITLAIAAYIGIGAVMDIAKSKRDRIIIAEAEGEGEPIVESLTAEVTPSVEEPDEEVVAAGQEERPAEVREDELIDTGQTIDVGGLERWTPERVIIDIAQNHCDETRLRKAELWSNGQKKEAKALVPEAFFVLRDGTEVLASEAAERNIVHSDVKAIVLRDRGDGYDMKMLRYRLSHGKETDQIPQDMLAAFKEMGIDLPGGQFGEGQKMLAAAILKTMQEQERMDIPTEYRTSLAYRSQGWEARLVANPVEIKNRDIIRTYSVAFRPISKEPMEGSQTIIENPTHGLFEAALNIGDLILDFSPSQKILARSDKGIAFECEEGREPSVYVRGYRITSTRETTSRSSDHLRPSLISYNLSYVGVNRDRDQIQSDALQAIGSVLYHGATKETIKGIIKEAADNPSSYTATPGGGGSYYSYWTFECEALDRFSVDTSKDAASAERGAVWREAFYECFGEDAMLASSSDFSNDSSHQAKEAGENLVALNHALFRVFQRVGVKTDFEYRRETLDTYRLGLSLDYEENRWGVLRIALDFLQNHADAARAYGDHAGQLTLAAIKFQVDGREGWLPWTEISKYGNKEIVAIRFSDEGWGYSHQHLQQFGSQKRKSESVQVGQFGEGLKIASAASLRLGFDVSLRSQEWAAEAFSYETVLNNERYENLGYKVFKEVNTNGSETIVGCPQGKGRGVRKNFNELLDTVRDLRRLVLRHRETGLDNQDPQPLASTEIGDIISLEEGDIYVKDFFITSEERERLLFAYNFADIETNRDRDIVSNNELKTAVGNILSRVNSPTLIKKVIAQAAKDPYGQYHEFQDLNKFSEFSQNRDLWAQIFRRLFSADAVLMSEKPNATVEAEFIGYKVINVNKDIAESLHSAGILYDYEVISPEFDYLDEGILTAHEREVLGVARFLDENAILFAERPTEHRVFGEAVNSVDKRPMPTLKGCADPKGRFIAFKRETLRDAISFLTVYIEEKAHQLSGAPDGSRKHFNEVVRTAIRLIRSLKNNAQLANQALGKVFPDFDIRGIELDVDVEDQKVTIELVAGEEDMAEAARLSPPDQAFEGGEVEVDPTLFRDAWRKGTTLNISPKHLKALKDPAMGPEFRVPEVRLVPKGLIDSVAPGLNAVRLNNANKILIVHSHWNSFNEQEKLDLLMHEAMADWMQRERREIPAEDVAIDLEGLKVDEKARRKAHKGVEVDLAMAGAGYSVTMKYPTPESIIIKIKHSENTLLDAEFFVNTDYLWNGFYNPIALEAVYPGVLERLLEIAEHDMKGEPEKASNAIKIINRMRDEYNEYRKAYEQVGVEDIAAIEGLNQSPGSQEWMAAVYHVITNVTPVRLRGSFKMEDFKGARAELAEVFEEPYATIVFEQETWIEELGNRLDSAIDFTGRIVLSHILGRPRDASMGWALGLGDSYVTLLGEVEGYETFKGHERLHVGFNILTKGLTIDWLEQKVLTELYAYTFDNEVSGEPWHKIRDDIMATLSHYPIAASELRAIGERISRFISLVRDINEREEVKGGLRGEILRNILLVGTYKGRKVDSVLDILDVLNKSGTPDKLLDVMRNIESEFAKKDLSISEKIGRAGSLVASLPVIGKPPPADMGGALLPVLHMGMENKGFFKGAADILNAAWVDRGKGPEYERAWDNLTGQLIDLALGFEQDQNEALAFMGHLKENRPMLFRAVREAIEGKMRERSIEERRTAGRVLSVGQPVGQERIDLIRRLALMVNEYCTSCYSASLVLHRILTEAGLQVRFMELPGHFWIEIEGLIIDAYPLGNPKIPILKRDEIQKSTRIIMVRKDDREYGRYYEGGKEVLEIEIYKTYQKAVYREFISKVRAAREKEHFDIVVNRLKGTPITEPAQAEAKGLLEEKPPLPLEAVDEYLQPVYQAITRPVEFDLVNGKVARDRALLGTMGNGLKKRSKYIIKFSTEKTAPMIDRNGKVIEEIIDRDLFNSAIGGMRRLLEGQDYESLVVVQVSDVDELEKILEENPDMKKDMKKDNTFIYTDNLTEGARREDVQRVSGGYFKGYMLTNLDFSEGIGYISIGGLIALALKAMHIAEGGEPNLDHIYNLLAALQSSKPESIEAVRKIIEKEWRNKGWDKNPIEAFISGALNIRVVPIEINKELRRYYRKEAEFSRAL